jgi:small-conductance mechanosensitive channel
VAALFGAWIVIWPLAALVACVTGHTVIATVCILWWLANVLVVAHAVIGYRRTMRTRSNGGVANFTGTRH